MYQMWKLQEGLQDGYQGMGEAEQPGMYSLRRLREGVSYAGNQQKKRRLP